MVQSLPRVYSLLHTNSGKFILAVSASCETMGKAGQVDESSKNIPLGQVRLGNLPRSIALLLWEHLVVLWADELD